MTVSTEVFFYVFTVMLKIFERCIFNRTFSVAVTCNALTSLALRAGVARWARAFACHGIAGLQHLTITAARAVHAKETRRALWEEHEAHAGFKVSSFTVRTKNGCVSAEFIQSSLSPGEYRKDPHFKMSTRLLVTLSPSFLFFKFQVRVCIPC